MSISKTIFFLTQTLLFLVCETSFSQTQVNPLVLQEMTWTDIKDYLTQSDMVIIPIGSTEQHGPHLPLGTDYDIALDMSKQISSKTGVVVAPVLLIGYSVYHSGFPGTLSIRPETMEQVLFEVSESMIKYGFRRLMFFNSHGGNSIVQDNVIHRINHETGAIAIAIGDGSPIQKPGTSDSLDFHAGVEETSIMLYLEPDFVKKERAQKPILHFTPQVEELQKLSKTHPELANVWDLLIFIPEETKKGGTSHEVSSNGVWSLKNPKNATAEIGRKVTQDIINRAVTFIEDWKKVLAK